MTHECPACGHENIHGVDSCEECQADLSHHGIPSAAGTGLRRRILEEPVSRLRHQDLVEVHPSMSAAEAVRLLKSCKVGCVLVVDGGKLVGILTERDVLNRLSVAGQDLEAITVRQVMTADPAVLRDEDPINFAMNRMSVGGFRHMPVVTSQGRPTGFISVRDVLRYIHETPE
ncbi:MAG: CBS domain-containing protein [Planctomycetes bacterium]|nr:CBS domain-containing protein [Planctomycetota bacterium]